MINGGGGAGQLELVFNRSSNIVHSVLAAF